MRAIFSEWDGTIIEDRTHEAGAVEPAGLPGRVGRRFLVRTGPGTPDSDARSGVGRN
jgi:hypothetical protein